MLWFCAIMGYVHYKITITQTEKMSSYIVFVKSTCAFVFRQKCKEKDRYKIVSVFFLVTPPGIALQRLPIGNLQSRQSRAAGKELTRSGNT